MRTVLSPKTGITWRLCAWNEACQVPVCTVLDGKDVYCRWHARCLSYVGHAHQFELFAQWLEWMQSGYPSAGWWGWPADRLWPVLQGLHTVWAAEEQAA